MLFILLFIALCVKLDPGTHKGMHPVLVLKLGVMGSLANSVSSVEVAKAKSNQQNSGVHTDGN
jgi:hypothetical protein